MNIFDASEFITRDCCGRWGNWSIAAQVCDGLICLAYLMIPRAIHHHLKNKPKHTKASGYAFEIFIVLCGIGHACDVLSFYWPAYKLFTIIDGLTAVASIIVAATAPVVVAGMIRSG